MNRNLIILARSFAVLTNKNVCCYNSKHQLRFLQIRTCPFSGFPVKYFGTSATYTSSSIVNKRMRGGKKRRRLEGTGSILTVPGVPIPHEMQRDDLVKFLVNSAIIKDNIIAITKPSGLSVSGGQSSEEINFLQLLPDVAEAIGHPSAEVVKGPERETSGLLLLGHNKAIAEQIAKQFSAAKTSKKLFRKYLAVTVGIPSPAQGVINEPIGVESIGDQLLSVIRHDASKKSFRRKKPASGKPSKQENVNKRAETHYSVLRSNKDLNCAQVELTVHTLRKNQLQVHLTHKLYPLLGDHLYSNRVRNILGVPVHMDPHQALPNTQNVGPLLKRALLIRSGLLHRLPLHLHWHQVILPEWRDKKDVCITVPPPDYFYKTLELLDVSDPSCEKGPVVA